MEIILNRTGDPWMDWGMAALYDYLRNQRRLFNTLSLTSGHLVLETRDNVSREKYVSQVYNYLQQCLNELILPAPEMKALQVEHRILAEGGFYDPYFKITLAHQQKTELKDKLNNISPRPEVTLRRNYVGLKRDWSKLGGELRQDLEHFFAQHAGEGKFNNYCNLCGRPVSNKMTYKMRQNKNPFYNQHHNNRIRGHANNVTTGDMCPTCNLLNIFATVQHNVPYFIDSSRMTHLILPRIDDLTVLHKIFSHIKSRLADLLTPGIFSYGTNIDGLRRYSMYQAITGVYFNIVHRYIPEEEDYREEPLVDDAERQAVRRWVVLRYSKGTNVNFAHFNYLDVHPRMFELVRSIKYGRNGSKEGNVYTTFLGGLSCRERRVLDDLARGIVQGKWPVMARGLLAVKKELHRSSGRVWTAWNALEFGEEFIKYALTEVDQLLDPKLAEDIKNLGRNFGRDFYKDIAFFTSLNNAPDAESFCRVLREALLKVYKLRRALTKESEKQENKLPDYYESQIENIINSIEDENIEKVKDTLLIYSLITAMRELKREQQGRQKQNDESQNVEAGVQ